MQLDSKAELSVLLGDSTVAKGYKMYNVSSKKVFVSRDVALDESSHYDWDRDTIVKNQDGSTSNATQNHQKGDKPSIPTCGTKKQFRC